MHNNIRYVTHIDILGMSALVLRNPEQAWEVLSDLVEVRKHSSRLGIEITATKERFRITEKVHSVMFSDTILLFSNDDSESSLKALLIATGEIFHKAMFSGIPVRIGVAMGKFFHNQLESMFAGPALIEAYHIGEEAQWIGISVSEAVYLQSKAFNFKSGRLRLSNSRFNTHETIANRK